jgi:multifunctional beta-oxidation protein
MVGFTETLAKEGVKYNILSNVIAPIGKLKIYKALRWPNSRCRSC